MTSCISVMCDGCGTVGSASRKGAILEGWFRLHVSTFDTPPPKTLDLCSPLCANEALLQHFPPRAMRHLAAVSS